MNGDKMRLSIILCISLFLISCNKEKVQVYKPLTGQQGSPGTSGQMGQTGATGPQGQQGLKGDSGLQGPQGTPGVQGPQGIQGVSGASGKNGMDGQKGQQGPQGLQGLQGPIGPKGDTGPAGSKGMGKTSYTLSSKCTKVGPTYYAMVDSDGDEDDLHLFSSSSCSHSSRIETEEGVFYSSGFMYIRDSSKPGVLDVIDYN